MAWPALEAGFLALLEAEARSLTCTPAALSALSTPPSPSPSPQTSAFLRLPADVFSCVLDYLARDDAWSLLRVCRGMAASDALAQLLYHYPLQQHDVAGLYLRDWYYQPRGRQRWHAFQRSITDANRRHVHRLALSHWASLDDFAWIDANLPALVRLDLTAIKDFVWSPAETWTWRQLARACPALFARLHALDVVSWVDYRSHTSADHRYALNDYRFTEPFRLSRRRDGGSVAQELFPACTSLKTLAIAERPPVSVTWNEWDLHTRICSHVDSIQRHCPPTLTRLEVADSALYRSLFATSATSWPTLTRVDINLHPWTEGGSEAYLTDHMIPRIVQGHNRRDEEDAFDGKTFESCQRDHLKLGGQIVQSPGASLDGLLQELHAMSVKHPSIYFDVKPSSIVDNPTIHPFHLVNFMQRRSRLSTAPIQRDPISHDQVQGALRWLLPKCDWKPIISWDSMMCDEFPANLEVGRAVLPKPDVLSRIHTMTSILRDFQIPLRISIGDRPAHSSFGIDGHFFFGDYKTFAGAGDDRHELLLPSQARFNLTSIAHMVDELTIRYPIVMHGVGWGHRPRRPNPAEAALMQREKTGWRRFWTRYAPQLCNLKKLAINIPAEFYADWAHSALPELLADARWQMLDVPDDSGDYGFFGRYFPFSSRGYSFRDTRTRRPCVQRVFFRLDDAPLELRLQPGLDDAEREDAEIADDMICDRERDAGRFWVPSGEKRKRDDEDEDESAWSKACDGEGVRVGYKRIRVE